MDTINTRIREIRKESGLSQKSFASELGLTQTGVSHIEQEGHNVSDITIKSICHSRCISEAWLRFGILPKYMEQELISLDDFVKNRGATTFELELMMAYFDLDPEIRQAAISHFRSKLSLSSDLEIENRNDDEVIGEAEAAYLKKRSLKEDSDLFEKEA